MGWFFYISYYIKKEKKKGIIRIIIIIIIHIHICVTAIDNHDNTVVGLDMAVSLFGNSNNNCNSSSKSSNSNPEITNYISLRHGTWSSKI